jgi:hypothetical protein
MVLFAAGIIGAVLLVVATFTTVIEIKGSSGAGGSVFDANLSGYDRHSIALVLLAAFSVALLLLAPTDAWPTMAALAACGAVTLGIVLLGDARHIHDTGEVGRLFDRAVAGAGTGFYLESLGGALVLLAGGGLLLLRNPGGE